MKIQRELNPIWEVIALSFSHLNRQVMEEEVVRELNKMGIDGALFYKTHYGAILSYMDDFSSKYVPHRDQDFLFGITNLGCMNFLVASLIEHPNWIEKGEALEEKEIMEAFCDIFSDEMYNIDVPPKLDTLEEKLVFLEKMDLTDSEKWKVLSVLQNPKKWTLALCELYRQNVPAFEYALANNRKQIDLAIATVADEGIKDSAFQKVLEQCGIATIYPSVAAPLSVWGGNDAGFYGVLTHYLYAFEGTQEQEKSAMVAGMKLLGDKSKFEILYMLKNQPQYNLEIAEKLHLTTATTSHHMNLLLTQGFVTIEKKDSKVYYHFVPEKMKQLIGLMEKYFLNDRPAEPEQ